MFRVSVRVSYPDAGSLEGTSTLILFLYPLLPMTGLNPQSRLRLTFCWKTLLLLNIFPWKKKCLSFHHCYVYKLIICNCKWYSCRGYIYEALIIYNCKWCCCWSSEGLLIHNKDLVLFSFDCLFVEHWDVLLKKNNESLHKKIMSVMSVKTKKGVISGSLEIAINCTKVLKFHYN